MAKSRLKRYKLLEFDKLQDTLKLLVTAKPLGRVLIQGYPIWTDTDRYESLYVHGCKCAKCGLEASFAAIEKETSSKDKFHINVYGTRKSDGKHIVLTKDHIYPRSMGGLDIMENYQTLCASCNCNKNNEAEISVGEAIEKGLTTREIQNKLVILKKKEVEMERRRAYFEEARKDWANTQREFQELLPKRDKKEFI